MEIGLLSDTHGYLDKRLFRLFESCDEVWHAGDFGPDVADALLAHFPVVRGVHGNIDDDVIRDQFPQDLRFECQGMDVLLTHIAGRPGRYSPRIRAILKADPPDLLVYGHSHILHIEKDARFRNMQTINPGAAGHYGDHQQRTVLKFRIQNGQLAALRLIELGPRGRQTR